MDETPGTGLPTEHGEAVAESPQPTTTAKAFTLPKGEVTEAEIRHLLDSEDRERRIWAISQLLTYAPWDDLWRQVDRAEVETLFPELDLPANLRAAWARWLGVS
ncbi:MAG: hypothetical protein AAGN66_06690 [Acidobacteriota bacterium]